MAHIAQKFAIHIKSINKNSTYIMPIVLFIASLSLLAFLQNIWLSWHFPVYADEILYKMMHGRFLRDGGVNINLLPHCGQVGFTLAVPFWMIPFRLAEEFIYGRDFGLLHVREIGVLIHIASIIGIITITWLSIENKIGRLLATVGIIWFIGVGSLPFLLIMNRPELLIRAVVILWILLPFTTKTQNAHALAKQSLFAIFVIIIPFSAITSIHIKSIFFLPVALTSLWFLARNSRVRIIATTLLLLMAVSAFRYWTVRFGCPDVPSMEGLLGQGLDATQLLSTPITFLQSALINLLNFPTYWKNILFADSYTSQWLPPTPESTLRTVANAIISFTFITLTATTLIGSIVALVRGIRSKMLDRPGAILLSLTASLTIVAMGSITKYFVESPLMLPLLGFCGLLGSYQLSGAIRKTFVGVLMLSLGVAWVSSQAILTNSYTSHVKADWSEIGYLSKQPLSYNFSDYQKTRSAILQAAKQCDIDPDKMPRHLIVDALSYPAMKKAFQPFAIYYVVSSWPGPQNDLPRYLKRMRSAGLIASCSYLEPSLISYAKKTDDYCCIRDFGQLDLPDPVP